MKPLSNENYNLNPYSAKRISGFTFGVFFENDDRYLFCGWQRQMEEIKNALNGAYLLGVVHVIANNKVDECLKNVTNLKNK